MRHVFGKGAYLATGLAFSLTACSVRFKNAEWGEKIYSPILELQIDESSPTANIPLRISHGVPDSAYVAYCILENDTDSSNCAWAPGAVPAAYAPSTQNGAVQLSVWLQSPQGLASDRADSNVVFVDRVAPQIASFSVANADPTRTATLSLAYGTTTGSFSAYCLLENDTDASHCAWQTGALPGAFAANASEGTKILSLWLKDSAGNVSTRRDSNSVTLDTTAPTIALTSLTGGETVVAGSSVAVTWTGSDANPGANPISVETSSDGGSTWSSVAAGLANSGSYAWTTPNVGSTTYRVRVVFLDAAGNPAASASAANFTLDNTPPPNPVVAVVSPNGGEAVAGGASRTVSWVASGLPPGAASAKIEYTLDGGATWTTIATGLAPSGSVAWSVPNANAANARIRATVTDSSATDTADVSDQDFTVDSTLPSVTLTSLTGGQNLVGGQTATLSWIASDAHFGASPIRLEASSDGGSTWTTIAAGLANSGSYGWAAPAVDSSTYRVRVVATDRAGNAATSASAANFTIQTTAPILASVTVTNANPTNNAVYALSYGAITGSYAKYCVLENDSNVGDCAFAAGTLPATYAASGQGAKVLYFWLRDAAGNTSAAVASNSVTLDTVAPALTLDSLTGGQTVDGAIANTIAWTAADANFGVSPIRIEYSVDAGTTWTTIAAGTANSGSYSWTPGAIETAQARVRLTAVDQAGNSTVAASAADFRIDGKYPTVTLTSMNGGQAYAGGSTQALTWSAIDGNFGAAPIRLEYSLDAGGTWTILQAAAANSGSYAWTLPAADSALALARVTATDAIGHVTRVFSATPFSVDSTAPVVASVNINNGATNTGTPLVSVRVKATDAVGPISIRILEADAVTGSCQSQYADDSWQTYAASGVFQSYSFLVSAGDGTKKACVWAKDAVGHVTTISPAAGAAGVDSDSIEFQIGHPPRLVSVTAVNDAAGANYGTTTFAAGDRVRIAWSATDVEGLDDNPVSISYSTDNSVWKDVVTGLDIATAANITWMGSQTGNPTSYAGTYTALNAPTSSYFRIKVIAKDSSGNTSIAVLSNTLNTPQWSIYAGTTDRGVGGSSQSAALADGTGGWPIFGVNPLTNDLYAIDYGSALRKIDAATGIVSTYVKYGGSTSLPASGGTIGATSALNTSNAVLRFDSNGLMYVSSGSSTTTSSKIYQINPATGTSTLYLGGGTANDGTATPSTVFMSAGPFAFDESNSVYFVTACTPGTWATTSTNAMRLMKMTQNPDHSAGTVSVVAGDCSATNPSGTGPTNALTSPFARGAYSTLANLAVWNNGQAIYYSFYGGINRKILNGNNYSTAATSSAYQFAYSAATGKLYATNSGALVEYTPNLSGANGETSTTYASASGTGNCLADGVDAVSACVNAASSMVISPQGTLLFGDGPAVNSPRNYRVRYRDSLGKLRTLAGTLPFSGDGLDKGVIRGTISGIYYKQASEPNQSAFPEGLYFAEQKGMVIGKIDPANGQTTVLAGTQLGNGGLLANGATFDPTLNLGASYTGGNLMGLAFDGDGLPWFRATHALNSVDSSGKIVARQTVMTGMWEDAPDGADPKTYSSYVYGTYTNLALKGAGVFYIGSYYNATSGHTPPARISYFDFGGGTLRKIMGGATSVSAGDSPTAGTGVSQTLDGACLGAGGCFQQYRADQDRLYFSELTKIRYLEKPTDTSQSSLGTLFTQPAGKAIGNFVFSPSGDQVFYVSGGALYCRDISSGKAWCDDSVLGPRTGMPAITQGANQFTWRDAGHLLISNYAGYVFEYALPP